MVRICCYICKQDGYKTGCVNAACGFVQVSRKVAFGATIEPVSQYNGKQYETYMSIRKVMQIYIPSEMLPWFFERH